MSKCPICKKEECYYDRVGEKHRPVSPNSDDSLEKDCVSCCPEQIPTQRFPSPNSPLPPDLLDELQRCIEEANDLLRTLGNDRDSDNTRQLQLHLIALQGVYVRTNIACGKKSKEKAGLLKTAGKDFIQLTVSGKYIFIPHEHLHSLAREIDELTERDQVFIDADKNTKKQLVLNFGEFVSKQPKLINLFFGNPLHLQLKKYIGSEIKVEMDGKKVTGNLYRVKEGEIQIKKHKKVVRINRKSICFIELTSKFS